jgi:hypothetical protein
MWITNGDKYVNLAICSSFGISETANGDVCFCVNDKAEFVLDMEFDEATFRLYEMIKSEGGPNSEKVLHLADCGMISAQFFVQMNDYNARRSQSPEW